MSLSEYQKNHSAWVIICFIFAGFCFEYDTMSPLPFIIEPGTSTFVHVPAMLPPEWLPYILIVWIMGHVIIWAVNKFR